MIGIKPLLLDLMHSRIAQPHSLDETGAPH
jgi:hypothetical protein